MLLQASFTICLFAFSSSTSALTLKNIPAGATAASNVLVNLNYPTPTAAPSDHELRRRQEAQRTLLVGPDATCGYFGGNASMPPSFSLSNPVNFNSIRTNVESNFATFTHINALNLAQPWGCTASSTCAFATPTTQVVNSTTTTASGSVLCCDSASGCPTALAPTSCVDKGRFDVKTACTGSCLEDERVLKCTSGIYIFCNTIAFPTPSLSAFYCNYISNYEPVSALTAFSGQGGRDFIPTVLALPTATPSSSSSAVFSTAVSSPSLRGTSSAANPSASAAGGQAGGGDGGSKNSVNKGAIIGGVIGGIAGLALIVAGVFFVLRRRKQNARSSAEVAKAEAGNNARAAKQTSSSHGSESGKSEVREPVVEGKKVAAK